MPTYIYAITTKDHPLRLDDLQGVGEEATPLRTVRAGEVAAVVSDAPEGLRAKRRDVLAHEAVLESLMADGATLPMRFGLLGPDDDQVARALEQDGAAYRSRLAELAGHVEFNLKAARDEQDLLLEIVSESDRIRELNERTRSGAGGQDDRIALGELVAGQVAERNNEQAQKTLEKLQSAAARVSRAEPGAGYFLNASFLVAVETADEFVKAVREEADRRGETYTLTLTGPLPPYSFV
ncbi:GvpL/GvpF family gas vesicle protein [Streptomyces lavendulae]|uniref:GvpL/GvpF family gas vesicle protein n=1 Tax=Streptomyces lavendulae TaxID=1914 RepID=UPI0024A43420|nr:GvpL/GvpF family gas vesicle protein [Streptomyces lavendulae]GLX17039.1 gas vesicle protein [Streptomyces lavendulae subsp. lavendulae]GLX29546.1 gas vesicle protein [Streptomyces lavendulae subsp. lavendulae]